ncbi:pectate lyase superfamily protein-domain-containing protein [Fusarium tricinctum]|uniref:Pectate lyase superfamily protein-domain-containing protein n=1 Tax=Fusarium tricinctum TaxID=61284 RepID=A0A8K0RTJ8_9HYPO|nr:pectate lyase superfamily protein-domain-containing protein [Fusarium tricinctum]
MKFMILFIFALAGIAEAKYWLEEIDHLGTSPYYPDKLYKVFRNVKDFGAVGDGVADDTAAINAAISEGVRCIPGVCKGSTISPATVYIPSGTYLISSSLIDLYYTQIIGDPTNRPVIKASGSFSKESFSLIDANPYLSTGTLAWNSTNVFFRQIRNLVLDTTAIAPDFPAVGIHWPSSQATSITNCVFRLSTIPGNRHTGLLIEEGSGGLLNDLYFYGGGNATVLGNQQFTARNLWFSNADVAIWMTWDWGWTFKSAVFKNCRVGIKMDDSSNSVGSITILDSWFENMDIAIATTRNSSQVISGVSSLAMENIKFQNVNIILMGPEGVNLARSALDPSGSGVFVMGHYANSGGTFAATGTYPVPFPRSESLLDRNIYYERSKPHYDQVSSNSFISAKANGAYGDASHDDTEALNALFQYTAANGLIAYLDAGYYMVSDTVYIPPNAKIVGEALASIIMGTGPNFGDLNKPRPVVQVGRPGDGGQIEWSDTIVSTREATAGAILIQYNLYSPGVPSGMWDVHTRIGGFAGTYLQVPECPAIKGTNTINPRCLAAYMSFHITAYAGGLFTENCWFWVADHDLENQKYQRVSVFAGRGVLVEAQRGRIWLSASGSEHHVLYQYQLVNTRDVFIGQAQTEQAYFQPMPLAQYPFPPVPALNDPTFPLDCQNDPNPAGCNMGWGMRVINSTNIAAYGLGLYSFFNNYNDSCASNKSPQYCQERILSIQGPSSGLRFLGLSTVGIRVMVERDGVDLTTAIENNSTFADTLALYIS